MLRRCCCPIAVPILPGDVPMTAEGLRANEFLPYGRLAQSIAFFNAPGIERLYSGVTNSTASTEAIASLNVRATGGSHGRSRGYRAEGPRVESPSLRVRRGRGAPEPSRASD